jgi:pyrroline-5-carboxylate reductase
MGKQGMTSDGIRSTMHRYRLELTGKLLKRMLRKEQKMVRRMAAICLALALVGQATASFAAGHAKQNTGSDAGARVGSALGTVAYVPFKTAFCALGGTGSGLAYLFAGGKEARKIARQSCRGSWRVTPGAVQGKEKVHFVGH